jgi:hypothetical protein
MEKKNNFNKKIRIRTKLKKKKYTINLDWMMILKTNKTFTKRPRKKQEIKRIMTKY